MHLGMLWQLMVLGSSVVCEVRVAACLADDA